MEVDPSLAKVSHSLKRKHPEFRTSRLQLENETPTLEIEIEELETRKRIPQNFAAVLSRCLVNFENISVLFYMSVRFCLGLHFTSAFLILWDCRDCIFPVSVSPKTKRKIKTKVPFFVFVCTFDHALLTFRKLKTLRMRKVALDSRWPRAKDHRFGHLPELI